jgi:Heterokaryon incompatibility protein (HET)
VAILREWLKDCDHSDQHKSCRLSKSVFVPKRLLYVGEKGFRCSKVIETASHLSGKSVPYLALSHPWGKKSLTNVHFTSDKDNIKKRMAIIRDHELPLSFRHAVQMARQLKVGYIWIDSICILQKTDTDPGDFQVEAKSMESIYASAYCVIAASSAEGMNSGFLSDERLERIAIQLPQVDKNDQPVTYLCDAIDDFQGDVLDGPLNERGWALQERALARRTIFFTKNQTYWECSQGIRCETLSKLTKYVAATQRSSAEVTDSRIAKKSNSLAIPTSLPTLTVQKVEVGARKSSSLKSCMEITPD